MHGDLTYKALCGCRVKFFAEAGFRTSEMAACEQHNKMGQTGVRDRIVAGGRLWRDKQLGYSPEMSAPPMTEAERCSLVPQAEGRQQNRIEL